MASSLSHSAPHNERQCRGVGWRRTYDDHQRQFFSVVAYRRYYEVEMVFDGAIVYMHSSRIGRGDIIAVCSSGNARNQGALARRNQWLCFGRRNGLRKGGRAKPLSRSQACLAVGGSVAALGGAASNYTAT